MAAARRLDFLRASHSVQNIGYVLGLHAVLFVWFAIAREHLVLTAYICITPLVCVIHQRMLSEWYHEATHYNFVTWKAWNDPIADAFMSFFLGPSVAANRTRHFRHHAADIYFVDDDPETAIYTAQSRADLVKGFARDLSGLTALRAFKDVARPKKDAKRATGYLKFWFLILLAGHAIGFCLTVLAGFPEVYFFYYGALLTLYAALNRLRTYGQHAIVLDTGTTAVASPVSRTIFGNVWEWLVLNTPVMKYHHEHHAHPHLPYRALATMAHEAEHHINSHTTSVAHVIGPFIAGRPEVHHRRLPGLR